MFTLSLTIIAATNSSNEFQIVLDFCLKILPLAGWLFGAAAWWDAAGKKRYAAQQDFVQIAKSIKILEDNQIEIVKLIEKHEQSSKYNYTEVSNRIFRDMDAIKALINNLQIYLSAGKSYGRQREDNE